MAEFQILEKCGRSRHGQQLVKCRCFCGNEFTCRETHARNGHTKSCGCTRNHFRRTLAPATPVPAPEVASTFEHGAAEQLAADIASAKLTLLASENNTRRLELEKQQDPTNTELNKSLKSEAVLQKDWRQKIVDLELRRCDHRSVSSASGATLGAGR